MEGSDVKDFFAAMGAEKLAPESDSSQPEGSPEGQVSQEVEGAAENVDSDSPAAEGAENPDASSVDTDGAQGDGQATNPQYDWSEFGEGFDSADAVKEALAKTRTQNEELNKKLSDAMEELKKSVNPFKSKNIQLANELYEKYGEDAITVAGKLASLEYDEKDPIGSLVRAKVIENPSYAGHEAAYRQKLEERYGDLEEMSEIDRLELNDEAKKAVERAKSLAPEIDWVEPDQIIQKKNELRSQAQQLKQSIADKLSSFEFDGVTFPISNSSDLVDRAIGMLVDGGDISDSKLEEAIVSQMYVAKLQALESGELQEKWAKTKEAEIRAEILKEMENPSSRQHQDGQDTAAGTRPTTSKGISAWAESQGL